MKTLSEIGESGLIPQFSEMFRSKDPAVLTGIGDDAAVLKPIRQKILLTTDALLEGVHFDWRYTSPYLLGRKSLSVNLSDIAAMGGKPRWALLSLAVPVRESWERVEEFLRGLRDDARKWGVTVVGGDTDHSLKGWKISLSLVGEAQRPLVRSGAKKGDRIWVTGFLGDSALGLQVLKRKVSNHQGAISPFIAAHLDPTPRLREGEELAKKGLATSLIDVSDGFLLDLQHLCEASRAGARIEASRIPFALGYFELCRRLKIDPLSLAMGGGEDYELLFTAPVGKTARVLETFRRLKTPVTCVGEIVARKEGVNVLDGKGHPLKFSKAGYRHF
ncbi:MAG: thiamine-phosphate kinase [bacterium]